MLALPLKLEGCQLVDATGVLIAIIRGDMAEYRARGAEIVAAVNSHADLLAAAKDALDVIEIEIKSRRPEWDRSATPESAIGKLRAAIAKAEEPAP